MAENVHITHIHDTTANIRANMDAYQIGIATDAADEQANCQVHTNLGATRLYHSAMWKYTDISNGLDTYLDIDFKDITARGSAYVTNNLGVGTTSPDRKLHVETEDAVTNAVTTVARFSHFTSGTPVSGFGVGIDFEVETYGCGGPSTDVGLLSFKPGNFYLSDPLSVPGVSVGASSVVFDSASMGTGSPGYLWISSSDYIFLAAPKVGIGAGVVPVSTFQIGDSGRFVSWNTGITYASFVVGDEATYFDDIHGQVPFGDGNFIARSLTWQAKLRAQTMSSEPTYGAWFAVDRARGTFASPTKLLSGDLCGGIKVCGYADTLSWVHGPSIEFYAAEDWGNKIGSGIKFFTAVNGATAAAVFCQMGLGDKNILFPQAGSKMAIGRSVSPDFALEVVGHSNLASSQIKCFEYGTPAAASAHLGVLSSSAYLFANGWFYTTTGHYWADDTSKTIVGIKINSAASDSSIEMLTTDTNNSDPIQRVVLDKEGHFSVSVSVCGFDSNGYLQLAGDTTAPYFVKLLDSGNIGFSTTDIEGFTNGYRGIQLGDAAIMYELGGSDLYFLDNLFYDGAWKYRTTAASGAIKLDGGEFKFVSAPSGTINTTASALAARFYITNTGNVGINVDTPACKLDVGGDIHLPNDSKIFVGGTVASPLSTISFINADTQLLISTPAYNKSIRILTTSNAPGATYPAIILETGARQDIYSLLGNLASHRIGDCVTNYSAFEADGTLCFHGTATVWKDVAFPMSPPKTTGTGAPTLVTWNTVFRNYAFAVGDAHDFDPQETPHEGKVGATTAQLHVHFVNRTDVAATRYVKWQIDFSQVNAEGTFPAATTVSAEYTIPANTPVGKHILFNVGSPFTTLSPGAMMTAKLTRIAASGTAPATDPVVLSLHYHYESDTVGSREIITK